MFITMRLKFNVPEYSIQTEYQYTSDILQEGKQFPVLTIGRDSYIEEAIADTVVGHDLVYNLQIGRYSAIASDISFIIDLNHDYKKVSQGRISGVPYQRPVLTKRKGQIIIMNDCWIGEKATFLSGVTIGNGAVVAAEAVVTKDVPPFAIVAGNPARVIGYRFETSQIEALNLIRWWNWPADKVLKNAEDLQGNIHTFIRKNIGSAKQDLSSIMPIDIKPIPKKNIGEEKIFLYIPDFEQDYPTYPNVIESFIRSYSNTNHELLL
ncbi:MAG: CatB-related O-acetyltransferase, partial [Lachnospiraceae bacterium]|nr:CatB-related O-acetyltransferase [Lachnospiraceae bacterium]